MPDQLKRANLLWKGAEVLTVPVDKLDKTAEKTVKELKEANVEKRRLIKELAEKEGLATQSKLTKGTVEIDGVALIKRDFGDITDVNRMVQTATEMILSSTVQMEKLADL